MKTKLIVVTTALALAGPVFAQGTRESTPSKSGAMEKKPESGMQGEKMDMSKMGPWTRKPTNESQTKKDVMAFFKQEDELMKKGDFEGSLSRLDFPVYMLTDDKSGKTTSMEMNREQYAKEMKPFYEQMPKDMKMTHKQDVTVLSDSIVAYTDSYTMTAGKEKHSGKSAGLLVKKDGQWKWKVMSEAGWGEMAAGTGGSGEEGMKHEESSGAPHDKSHESK